MNETDDLPTVTNSGTLNVAGYELTTHVLSDGRRIYEDTPELRRMLGDLGFSLSEPEPIEAEVVK